MLIVIVLLLILVVLILLFGANVVRGALGSILGILGMLLAVAAITLIAYGVVSSLDIEFHYFLFGIAGIIFLLQRGPF